MQKTTIFKKYIYIFKNLTVDILLNIISTFTRYLYLAFLKILKIVVIQCLKYS